MTRGWPKGSHLTEELKAAVHKYLKKITAVKIGFSRYRLTYYFLDGNVMSGTYFSTNKRMEMTIDDEKRG